MEFTNPTTKEQMYEVLQDIFYYYRIRRESWEQVELQPLKLNRIEFNKSTEEEILELAEKLVSPEIKLKKNQAVQQLILAKSELSYKTASLNQQIPDVVNGIIALYDKQVEECKEQLSRLNTINSSIETIEINKIRQNQNEEVSKIRQEYSDKIALLEGEILGLENQIAQTEEFYSILLQEEIDKKVEELKMEENKHLEDVNKYNSSLDEKELKHANDIVVKQANLELKYKELNQAFFSKDQLVEMGYYKDVLSCVCAYYNTLEPMNAYQDFMNETKVVIYLEDYYTNILYLYRAKAGQ